ncbi:MAG: BMP family lipoprotein [Spirochaetia bacterium]
MKRVSGIFFAAGMIFSMLACSAGQGDGMMVSMVTDAGGVNDQSFNQAAWEGLTALKKKNGSVRVNYYESKSEADYAPFLQNAVDNGAHLAWGIGYKLAPAISEASAVYPENKFGIIDFSFEPVLPNVVAVVFRVQEAAFLAGYLAGSMTKTGKLGFIGGFETPIINDFEFGFRAGVARANPDIQVYTQYTASFTDSNKGKAIAQTMIEQGVDLLFPVAGDAGNGAIELARERNIYVIGVDRDQSYLAPDQMLTSVLKRVDSAMSSVSQEFVRGNFEAGTHNLGLIDEAVGLAPINSKLVADEKVIEEINEFHRQIVTGEIEVPTNKEQFLAMGYKLTP